LTVNGQKYQLDVPGDMPLLWVLRDHLKLSGTKYSCGIGECGSCTVLIDGQAERSCKIPVEEAQKKKITTIEGIPESHPVKRAWVKEQVVQCGYCQPGVIMQVIGLTEGVKNPDADAVIKSMDDVICRCGTYHRMRQGIRTAVGAMKKEGKGS
jgi:isoquinoline 1-oxidoreductase alpha subunit